MANLNRLTNKNRPDSQKVSYVIPFDRQKCPNFILSVQFFSNTREQKKKIFSAGTICYFNKFVKRHIDRHKVGSTTPKRALTFYKSINTQS